MSLERRNEWLEAEQSDEEDDQGYDSEAADERPSHRATKRRRISRDEDEDELSDNGEGLNFSLKGAQNKGVSKTELPEEEDENIDAFELQGEDEKAEGKAPRKIAKTLLKAREKSRKSGVIYLSRIPPFMKPATVKSYLEPFGPVGRIFLTPEDPTSHSKRVRAGGNKKRSFVDGWVEFQSKRDAKACAETLNTQIVGGKKGSWYHDDVWNIKYLRGFKWANLVEQIQNENAERAARLRAEISQTTKENNRFIANVERAKMLEGIQKKRGDADLSLPAAGELEKEPLRSKRRYDQTFKQNAVRRRDDDEGEVDESTRKVLSKIF